jgi:hypothetical protein
VTLSWRPGIYAAAHNVYFGTDVNDVTNASIDDPMGVLLAQNHDTNSIDPGSLALGQTYYWRVDEVNDVHPDSPWQGMVFQFTVADYIVVENFESYNEIPQEEAGSNLVYNTWMDGYENQDNGGTIGYLIGNSLEYDTVHSGNQSAPLLYENYTGQYSEATVNLGDLPVGTDWTVDNPQTLSLWFHGWSNNGIQTLYVKLNDSKIAYDGPGSVSTPEWTEWRMDLATFNVDLNNVTTLSVGLDKVSSVGGFGEVLLDDLRLYVAE